MKTFEERLETESAGWVSEGLILERQREALLARHPVTTSAANRFLAILGGIGGALFLVGVSLVIKSNWERIHDWVKIGGLLTLLVGSYAAGWRWKMQPGHFPRLGDTCLMVGAVCFLLGIALVSQIFHIDSRPANGVLLWWVGIAAVPWLTKARGAQFVSTMAGLIWLTMELNSQDSWLRLTTGLRWYNEAYPMAAAAFWVGVILLGLGLGLRGARGSVFAGLHEDLGLLYASGGLYALGFTWSVHSSSWDAVHAARLAPVLVLLGLAVAAGIWAWTRREETKAFAGYLAVGAVPALAHLLGLDLGDGGWLWGGVSCLALFWLNLGMIRIGLATGREDWINLGMAGIALNVVTRYFLLFGTLLEGGVFFIVSGLLVLGLGFYLERKRRSLVGAMRKEATS
ncbi:MAG: DUF2157 domain-containing protein [Verrucomicrobiota bacterium]